MESYYGMIEEERQVGVDEAGRGCLFGPVVAAAVVWDPSIPPLEIGDSKKLSAKKRNEMREYIISNAIDYSIQSVSAAIIDEINILQATMQCMHKCLDDVHVHFDRILVDGNRFNKYKEIPHHCITKGDSKYTSIAAASILAKTYRDDMIGDMCKNNPNLDVYDLKNNKGYGTKKHVDALKTHGETHHHRKTFNWKKERNAGLRCAE